MGSITNTVTGAPATFISPAKADIQSLKCYFQPIQAGEGDPSPSNIREISGWNSLTTYTASKNLGTIQQLLGDRPYTEVTEDGRQCVYVKASGTSNIGLNPVSFENAFKQNTQYTISFYAKPVKNPDSASDPTSPFRIYIDYIDDTSDLLDIWPRNNEYEYILNTWTTFSKTSKANKTIKQLRLGSFEYRLMVYIDINTFQIEEGTQATSYEPYRGQTIPITFPIIGKNKLNSVWESGGINISTGEAAIGNTNIRLTNKIEVIPSTTYILSWSGNNHNIYRFAYHKDGTFSRYLGLQSASNTSAITFQSDEYYFWCYQYEETTEPSQMQFEIGSTATTYEPYSSNNTVYGGYIDLINGKLVQEYIKMVVDENSPIRLAYNSMQQLATRFYVSTNTVSHYHDLTKTCYVDKAIHGATFDNTVRWYRQGNTELNFYIPNTLTGISSTDDEETTITKLKAYLAENNFTYIFATQTPIEYKLSPIQLKTLIGRNNIWANTNDVTSVEYDIHESARIIQEKKKIIIGSAPHLETKKDNVASFNTDVIAPIKDAKFYFEPTQDGSGDPSPENVREISGWTGFNINHTGKNLLDPSIAFTTQGGADPTEHVNSDGSVTATFRDGTSWTERGYLDLPPGTYYFYSEFGSGYNSRYIINDVVSEVNFNGKKTVTITEPTRFRFKAAMGTEYPVTGWIQVFAANDTYGEYSYINNVQNITWTSNGTVYGGYIDLISGKLIATYQYLTVNENSDIYTYGNANYSGTYACNRCVNLPFRSIITHPMYQLTYIMYGDKINCYHKNYSWGDPDNHIWQACINAETQLHISFANNVTGVDMTTDTYSQSVTKIKNWLADNNLHFAIPLKTPQVITTLTPQQLLTFRGTNNIWSTANGQTEITYWTH